jgi:Flp pilus assembly protein TadD
LWRYAELALSQAGDDPRALAFTGLARDRQGEDGGAWAAEAVRRAPDDPQVRLLYGLHLRETGDYEASRTEIIAAAALDPGNPVMYAELGAAYQLTGDLAAAERWLTYAVNLADGDPAYLTLLDTFYREQDAFLRDLGLELTNEPIPPTVPAVTPMG